MINAYSEVIEKMKAENRMLDSFYYEFLDFIKGKDDFQTSRNKYHDDYTNYINKEKMPELLGKYGYDINYEYYRIDVVGWQQRKDNKIQDICSKVKMKPYLWSLEIAFEHENKINDWYDEVIKLLFVNCPVRVVVGYNKYSKRFDEKSNEIDTNKLKTLCKIIDILNNKEELLKNQILIILGNGGTSMEDKKYEKNEGENYFGYIGYILYLDKGSTNYRIIQTD